MNDSADLKDKINCGASGKVECKTKMQFYQVEWRYGYIFIFKK